MPRGDKTGPQGKGPMTGRGAGFCAGNEIAGFENDKFTRRGGAGMGYGYGHGMAGRYRGRGGFGYGYGRGMGFRQMENANTEVESTILGTRISNLEEAIKKLSEELKKISGSLESK